MPRPKKYSSEEERKAARNAAARARYAAKKIGPVYGPVNLSYKDRAALYPGTFTKTGKMRKTTKSGAYRKAPTRKSLVEFGPVNLSAAQRYKQYPATFTKAGKMRKRKAPSSKPRKQTGRAPNAYATFVKNNFASVRASNPRKQPKDIMKIIGSMWKSR
jgi:hypothetical protein